MSGLRWWGPKGGQGNALYLSMSDVVTSMGDMRDGGSYQVRKPLSREGNHANFDNITYRATIETGIVAFR